MKALSLYQPWATLIAIGAKKIETRSWSTSFRGTVAIHASKGFPKDCQGLCSELLFYEALLRGGYCINPRANTTPLPLGAIVAIAELEYVGRIEFNRLKGKVQIGPARYWVEGRYELAFGNYENGRYGWCFANIHRLPEPIPVKGALQLWDVPRDVELEIIRQVRMVPA